MTREIKFRHFGAHPYLETPSFVYLNLLACSANETLRFFRQGGCIEQYTGLKDKNNKEIYEGDIVKFAHEYTEREWDDYIEEVYYDEEIAGFLFGRKPMLGMLDRLKDVEVIGNIYENSEVLKT